MKPANEIRKQLSELHKGKTKFVVAIPKIKIF